MTQPSGTSAPGAPPPGIEAERVCAFFARHVAGGDAPLAFEILSGGRSNLTYLVSTRTQPVRHFVLRRPPLGHLLPTAHDMVREHRVLSALADTDVPVARPLALCDRHFGVNGAPFYVMEYRAGVVANERCPTGSPRTRTCADGSRPRARRRARAAPSARLRGPRAIRLRPSRGLPRATSPALVGAVGEARRRRRRARDRAS